MNLRNYAKTFRSLVPLFLTLSLVASTSLAFGRDDKSDSELESNVPLPEVRGPKRSVAVADFGTTTIFDNQYGLTNVGGGLAGLLATALVESDRFIVVERGRLSSVLAEQELAAAGMLHNDGQAAIGELLGAQYLLQGEITEFSEEAKGRGFSLGIGSGDRRVGLSPRKRTGVVGIDVRVINTSTGQIVEAFTVREEITARAMALILEDGNVSMGHDNFSETPLGQAARAAVDEVVRQFATAAASEAWQATVVDYDQYGIAINAGSESGVDVGDTFQIQRVTKVLTDPNTGRVLGKRAFQVGEITIQHVENGIAFGKYEPTIDLPARRGDIVTTF